jgi:hypothetical protein
MLVTILGVHCYIGVCHELAKLDRCCCTVVAVPHTGEIRHDANALCVGAAVKPQLKSARKADRRTSHPAVLSLLRPLCAYVAVQVYREDVGYFEADWKGD